VAGVAYRAIVIYTSERAHWKGSPLYEAIIRVVAHEKSAARCLVTRAVAGCYENGEVASHRVLDLSHNMPVKIEIILPAPELERVLDQVERVVGEGMVTVEERDVRVHRTSGGLLPSGLLVRDVMSAPPVSVKGSACLGDVMSVLVRSEFDGVPVTDQQDRLEGMITPEDLVGRAGLPVRPGLLAALLRVDDAASMCDERLFGPQSSGVKARDVMTPSSYTVAPDVPLTEAVKTMAKANLKRLPVVDEGNRLVGILARIDVLRVASAGTSRRRILERYGATVDGKTPVARAHLLDVPTVSPDAPALEVLDLIDSEGQRVVVLDDGRIPLGVISDKDLLPLLGEERKRRANDLEARSLMRTVPTIAQDASVEDALQWMVEHRRKRLPVVDDRGAYVGMLSREELLRILAPDA